MEAWGQHLDLAQYTLSTPTKFRQDRHVPVSLICCKKEISVALQWTHWISPELFFVHSHTHYSLLLVSIRIMAHLDSNRKNQFIKMDDKSTEVKDLKTN